MALSNTLPFLQDTIRTTPCPGCRVEVHLAPDPFGWPDYFRPLGSAMVKGADHMETRTVFVKHECPELGRWREMLAKERAEEEARRARDRQVRHSEENRLRKEANAATAKEQWAIATTIPCPKCGVPVGKKCENLMERRNRRVVATAWPHPERFVAAYEPQPNLAAQIEREGGIS